VHYDIEPYLLAGFQGRARQRLLTGYLELLEGMASRIRISCMTFGADIPFWYDTPDELTGQTYPIEFLGRRKPASEHVIDLVDIVVVMDYRTSAYGANGILALSEGELDYAAKAGKKLFVGLETTDLPDEDVIDFGGKPGLGLPGQAPAERRIFIAPDPAGARIWLVSPSQWGEFLEDIRARGTARDSLVWWPVRRISPVPASRLTFSSLGAASWLPLTPATF
jgi:hypothetical protein